MNYTNLTSYSDSVIWWNNICGNETLYDAFWSSRISVNTWHPDLTRCFQRTVLVWAPAIFLLVTGMVSILLYICTGPSTYRDRGPRSTLLKLKLVLIAFIGVCYGGDLCYYASKSASDEVPFSYLQSDVIYIGCTMFVALLFQVEQWAGDHTSGLQQGYWTLQLFVAIIGVRSVSLQPEIPADILLVLLYMSLTAKFILWVAVFIPDKSVLRKQPVDSLSHSSIEKAPLIFSNFAESLKSGNSQYSDEETKVAPAPESYCSFLVNITYMWFFRIAVQGWKRPITFEDLPDLLDRDKTKTLLTKFLRYWGREKDNASLHNQRVHIDQKGKAKSASLGKALLKTVLKSVLQFNCVRIFDLMVMFFNPLLLRTLLEYIGSDDPYTWKGVLLAFAMFGSTLAQNLLIERFLYFGYNTGMNLRTTTTAMVYRKILRLSSTARKQTTAGEMINLMSVDSQRLENLPPATSVLWFLPSVTIISTYLIWQTIGPACLAGVFLLAAIIPINGVWMANKIRKLQRVQMTLKDKRIRTVTEMFSGIKILKLYSWEKPFEDKVCGFRKDEIYTIRYTNILTALCSVAWNNATYLVTSAIFVTYVLISPENLLNPEKVFVTFALVNMLSFPLHLMPAAVNNASQAIISIKRLNKFLLLDEIDDDCVKYDYMADDAISITNGTFSWNGEIRPTLSNITLEIPPGQLVAVIGPVGCGKSSLISALLGELTKLNGNIVMKGSVAYVPQQAWIRNKTVRENILFDKPMVPEDYHDLLEACALTSDLKILSDGDETEIGEKGVNLSGGQKQRISLARAVYQDCSTYLLDDPLSAVDAHVGKHLFEKVIGPNGLLKDKTRILSTHNIAFLSQVDTIVLMKEGKIVEHGTFRELIRKQGDFFSFFKMYQDIASEMSSAGETSSSIPSSLIVANQPKRKRTKRKTKPRTSGVSSGSSYGASLSQIISGSSESKEYAEINEMPNIPKKLIKEETQQVGSVGMDVILDYVRAGGLWRWFFVLLFHLSFLTSLISGQIWLSKWSSDVNRLDIEQVKEQQGYRLGIYITYILLQVVFITIGSLVLAFANTVASSVYHSRLVGRLLFAPMSFFDVTPLGRILNRFSRDIDYLDTNIPMMVGSWLYTINPVIATLVLISYTTPIILAIVLPIGACYIFLQRFYISTGRQLRRIDSVKRSPIFAHFDESIPGAVSIRAYGREDGFVRHCDRLIDESQRALYHDRCSKRWLEVTMILLGSLVVFSAALFSVLQRNAVGEGLAGLSVSFALQFTLLTNFFVRAQSELDAYMVAAERVKEYSHVPQEAAYSVSDTQPEDSWPDNGVVSYDNYSTRYRPDLDLALKSLSFDTKRAEKVGIVGRTGAGKSSMALSLFRIIESVEGNIYIDGINIADLGLHQLRSKLTIIPQDPVVFSGSLRFNVDPSQTYADLEIWNALKLAHLQFFVSSLPGRLNYDCGENGENLSVGQRQLICLARAALRHSKILLLDEATSSVDLETDDLIQNTIRHTFAECTVITIAHRIKTILDYDRVIVMDNGCIKEIDAPTALLSNKRSIFYSMAKNAGLI